MLRIVIDKENAKVTIYDCLLKLYGDKDSVASKSLYKKSQIDISKIYKILQYKTFQDKGRIISFLEEQGISYDKLLSNSIQFDTILIEENKLHFLNFKILKEWDKNILLDFFKEQNVEFVN